ncbi:MAG TPA: hypothetical protein VK324_13645, partial [Tepidisphaeraceae bacterium]|nr:hypothetical protein [Tepidisphaeraceae bacterium]
GADALRVRGPQQEYRALRSYAPGTDGYRIYRLGRKHGGLWVAGGRLVAATRGQLEDMLRVYGEYQNGELYTFVSVGGNTYDECELTGYEAVSDVSASVSLGGYTVRVRGVVVRAAG